MRIFLSLLLLFACTAALQAETNPVAAQTNTSSPTRSAESPTEMPVPTETSSEKTTLLPTKPVQSKSPKIPAQLPEQSLLPQLLQVTFGLFVVLLVIAGAAWLTRRFGQFNVGGKGNLRIIGGLHMGARERVVLIQVGKQQLLLGVAPGRVEKLHVLDQPIELDNGDSPPAVGLFAKRLAEVMRGRK